MSTVAQAKRDFQNGLIRKFRIDRGPMGGAKYLTLLYTSSAAQPIALLLDARTKKPREFKTYDAAVAAAEQIGFVADSIGS